MTWSVSPSVQPLRSLVRPVADSMSVVKQELTPDTARLRLLRPADLLDQGTLTINSMQDVNDLEGPKHPEVLAPAGAILIGTEFPSSWTVLPVAVSTSKSRLGSGIRALLPARSELPPVYIADILRAASSRILVRARTTSRGIVRLDLDSLLQMPIPIPSTDQVSRLTRYRDAVRILSQQAGRLRVLIDDAKSALAQRAFSEGLSKNK